MMEYTIHSLGSFSEMKYGKMLNKKLISDTGKYPVYSGYRVVGYCDECNIDKQQLIVVARGVGGTGDVKLSPGACFLTNLSIAVFVDENVALKKYLYYYFFKNNLRYLDSGSAQSQITISDLKNVEIPLPSLDIQKKVVSILDTIDEKISNNVAINDNLAA
jgi:type I restriction enzyme S subunit